MIRKTIFAAVALLAVASFAHATIIASDDFNAPPTLPVNLVGTVPSPGPGSAWATHSGTTGPVQITAAGKVLLKQAVSSVASQDVNLPTGSTMGAGNVWYAGFDLSIAQLASPITPVYFAHFLASTSSFTSRLWVNTPTTSGYRLTLTNGSAILGGASSLDLLLGTTYRVVISYDYSAAAGKLWINDPTAASPIIPGDAGFTNAITAFAFRQGGSSASVNTEETIDNLNIGTSYAEAYPEPTTLALLVLGGFGLIRRRR